MSFTPKVSQRTLEIILLDRYNNWIYHFAKFFGHTALWLPGDLNKFMVTGRRVCDPEVMVLVGSAVTVTSFVLAGCC